MLQLVQENLKIALAEIRANPFRSALTTLGIIIAVSAVVAVVAIVQGASRFMLQQFEGLGTHAVWVVPHRPPGLEGQKLGRVELTYDEAQAIAARCPAVSAISPVVQRQGVIAAGALETSAQVVGTTPAFQTTRNYPVDQGRYFSQDEIDARANVAVVGEEVLRKLKTTRERVLGQPIQVNGHALRVIGFLQPKGSLLGSSQDELVVIPITTAFKLFGPQLARRVLVIANARTAEDAKTAVDQIRWLLRLLHDRRRGDPDDFVIFTQDQFLDSFRQVSVMITGLLSGVVSVALLVGGIGIMNIMLVSVTERTREIGIRKALGARNRDILVQFLVEAVALALLGGLVGIGAGFGAALFVREAIVVWVDFPPVWVPWWAIAIALIFSGSVGLVAGVYPAWKAARLDPIEALRHD